MDPKEKTNKIVSLLLNRTKSHNWYYFDIRLDDHEQTGTSQTRTPAHAQELQAEAELLLEKVEVMSPPYDIIGDHSTIQPVTSKQLYSLIELIRQDGAILTEVVRRIFDINTVLADSNIVQDAQSSASSGLLKKFNEKEKVRRDRLFKEKLRAAPNFRNDLSKVVVLAEGDSWFQFPKIYVKDAVKDIIDHLIADESYAVYSLAAGGDWLSNMLNESTQNYIADLTKIAPDVFLVSGGGNDLVSDSRIAHMVLAVNADKKGRNLDDGSFLSEKIKNVLLPSRMNREKHPHLDQEMYERGLLLLSDDFFRFVNICLVQYFTLFYRIFKLTNKFENMMVITHGYDFAMPSDKRKGVPVISFHWWVNKLLDSGKWLYDPLVLRGIYETEDQKAAIYAMIYEFNEMLISLARYSQFPNVFHIDCRGVASESDWYDELHLKSDVFEKIAKIYKKCIRENIMRIRRPPQTPPASIPGKIYHVA